MRQDRQETPDRRLARELGGLNVVIVTHVFATGPSDALEDYLKGSVKRLLYIGHPFSYCADIRSFYREYEDGKLIKERVAFSWRLPEVFMYIKDSAYSLLWILVSRQKYDLFIGINNLNAFMGLILKKIHRVKTVIFYTIDYVPKRFDNTVLNRIYHWIDKKCVRTCDFVWNLSPAMIEARKEKGIIGENSATQLVVPIGTDSSKIDVLPMADVDRHTLVFMGHLRKGQGVELAIESFPEVIKRVPNARLMIFGTGPLEQTLKERVKNLQMENSISFIGFVEDHDVLENMMARCAIAVAPYVPDPESFTWYADPGKPKAYMAAGLPVIITRVPQVAGEIERRRAGIAINYNQKELVAAVVKLLTDDNLFKEYRENAIEFARDYSWEKIFREALRSSLMEKERRR